MVTTGRRARRPEQKQQRREAILSSARDLWAEVGFFEFTMANLAQRCGLAKGTLYLYFKTKEELFQTLFVDDFTAWSAYLKAERSNKNNSEPDAAAALLLTTLEEYPDLVRLFPLVGSVLWAAGPSNSLEGILNEFDKALGCPSAPTFAFLIGRQQLRMASVELETRSFLSRLLGAGNVPVAPQTLPSEAKATSTAEPARAVAAHAGQWIQRY